MRSQRTESSLRLDNLVSARAFFARCITKCDPTRESLWVAHVDWQARFLHLTRHDGDEIGSNFPVRDIIVDAVAHRSSGILLAHNHPSGDPTPSSQDCRATRRLATAAEALDCRILDHLVFAGDECASFQQMGLL